MVSRRRELSASARDAMAVKIKELIEANPLFQDKLEFPSFVDSRLRVLVNQRCYVGLNLACY
jgi:hypothetical protein